MNHPKYPNDSEHEYILWIIQSDYLIEREVEVDDSQRVDRFDWVQERRWRREEILQRLYLDTQLRKEGTTYAKVVERSSVVVMRT